MLTQISSGKAPELRQIKRTKQHNRHLIPATVASLNQQASRVIHDHGEGRRVRRSQGAYVDMWLLTVRSGVPGARDETRRRSASALWTVVVLSSDAYALANAPTAANTAARGRPPRCPARPAHLNVRAAAAAAAPASADASIFFPPTFFSYCVGSVFRLCPSDDVGTLVGFGGSRLDMSFVPFTGFAVLQTFFCLFVKKKNNSFLLSVLNFRGKYGR